MQSLPIQTCFPLEQTNKQEPWSLALKIFLNKFGELFINLYMYYQNYKDLTFFHLYSY